MNELIIKNENGNDAVLCSDLFKRLGLETKYFNRWQKKNITNNPFAIENLDFLPLKCTDYTLSNKNNPLNTLKEGLNKNESFTKTRNRQRKQDFVLSLDFAKRLAMLCRTKEGEAVRKYFLFCEQLAKDKENYTIQFLKNRLSIYERMEQIRTIRRNLYKQMQELKTAMTTSNQAPENNNYQLTLNFN